MAIKYVNLAEIMGQIDNARVNEANIQRQQKQSEMDDYSYQRTMRQDADTDAMRNIYKNSVSADGSFDEKKLLGDMLRANPEQGLKLKAEIEKRDVDRATLKNTNRTADITYKVEQSKYFRDRFANVIDQQSYDGVLNEGREMGAGWVQNAPVEYNPEFIKANAMNADAFVKQNSTKPKIGFTPSGTAYDELNPNINIGDNYGKSASSDMPANVKEYEYAKNQGYQGNFNDFKNNTLDTEKPSQIDLGAPRPSKLPWESITNEKERDKFKQKEYTLARSRIDKMASDVNEAKIAADDSARFMELNAKTGTGGAGDKVGIGRFARSLGDNYAEMEAITAKIAPNMRPEGSGATSNFDASQFQRATVGVDKTGNANKNIAAAIQLRAKNASDHQDYLNTYLEQNETLAGADSAWAKYQDTNPIFDKTKSKDFGVNQSRKDWKTYFGEQSIKEQSTSNAYKSKVPPKKYPHARQAPDGNWYVKDANGQSLPVNMKAK